MYDARCRRGRASVCCPRGSGPTGSSCRGCAGLGTYWEQFPGLREELTRQTGRVVQRLRDSGGDVVVEEFISWPEEAPAAGDRLRAAGLDLLVVHLATYCTSSQVLPAVQRAG